MRQRSANYASKALHELNITFTTQTTLVLHNNIDTAHRTLYQHFYITFTSVIQQLHIIFSRYHGAQNDVHHKLVFTRKSLRFCWKDSVYLLHYDSLVTKSIHTKFRVNQCKMIAVITENITEMKRKTYVVVTYIRSHPVYFIIFTLFSQRKQIVLLD